MSDAVKDMYNSLIDIGFTQNQIDEMDIVYHLQLLAHRNKSKTIKNDDEVLYIDQVLG